MSDSKNVAGAGSMGDPQRVRRFDPDALFGPGMERGEDGRWSPALAGALYVNADDRVELRTDGTTLVQEAGSPITMKAPVQAAVTKAIAAVGTAATAGLARLTNALAALTTTVATKMTASRAFTVTENMLAGEGLEIVEGAPGNPVILRPKSNAGTADVQFRLQALGTDSVYINGDIPATVTALAALRVPIVVGSTTLVLGTKAVAIASIQAGATVLLTVQTIGGTVGVLSYTVAAGVGITISSVSALDTSVVSYAVWNP